MLKVNNRKTLINLAHRTFRANKKRNIVVVIAIVLTTLLFTTVFTMGIGLFSSIQTANFRRAGSTAHASLKFITEEQLNLVKENKSIKQVGLSLMLCENVENKSLAKRVTEFWYYDQANIELSGITLEKGNMPLSSDEIIADTKSLELLGVPIEVGQKIKLQLNIKGEVHERVFRLSGYWKSDLVFNVGIIIASEAYVKEHREELSNTYYDDNFYTGSMQANILFPNSINIESKLNALRDECGFSFLKGDSNYVASNVNWAYMTSSLGSDFSTVFSLAATLFLIILAGYLIIYNIFQISVIQDVRFYGLLKSLGTTGRQIKRLINMQALTLTIMGIPLGIILGFVLGNILVPFLIRNTNYADIDFKVSLHPLIVICSSLFTLFTVFFSIKKPCRTASNISPIEAIRFSDRNLRNKSTARHNTKFSLWSFALANLGNNRKRSLITIVSLTLGIVLLNTVFILANSIDMDKLLNKFLNTDFLVAHQDYFKSEYNGSNDSVGENFIGTIEKIPGFDQGGRIYGGIYSAFYTRVAEGQLAMNVDDQGYGMLALYGLDELPLNHLEIIEGELDPLKLVSGKYILYGIRLDDQDRPLLESSNYNVGDSLSIFSKSKRHKQDFIILGKVAIKTKWNTDRTYWGDIFYLPSDQYLKMLDEPKVMSYVFNVESGSEEQTEAFLKEYTSEYEPTMSYESKGTIQKTFRNTKNTVFSVGGSLSIILGLIAILNFINVSLTSIIARRHEFAILRSIGMTKKQLKRMLAYEGFLFAFFTAFLASVLCLFSAIVIVKPLVAKLWFLSFKPLFIPLLVFIPLIFFLAYIIPILIYSATDKNSIIEQLKSTE